MLGILSVNSFVVHDGEEDNMDLIGNKLKKFLPFTVYRGADKIYLSRVEHIYLNFPIFSE